MIHHAHAGVYQWFVKNDLLKESHATEIDTFVDFGSVSFFHKSRDFSQDADFVPPIYNVWTFGKKSNNINHFGNSEQRIVDNLLYLYTEPFSVIIIGCANTH